jgi:hypothetical protein
MMASKSASGFGALLEDAFDTFDEVAESSRDGAYQPPPYQPFVGESHETAPAGKIVDQPRRTRANRPKPAASVPQTTLPVWLQRAQSEDAARKTRLNSTAPVKSTLGRAGSQLTGSVPILGLDMAKKPVVRPVPEWMRVPEQYVRRPRLKEDLARSRGGRASVGSDQEMADLKLRLREKMALVDMYQASQASLAGKSTCTTLKTALDVTKTNGESGDRASLLRDVLLPTVQ